MKKDGLKLVTMSLVACLSGFAVLWILSAWRGFDWGHRPGHPLRGHDQHPHPGRGPSRP